MKLKTLILIMGSALFFANLACAAAPEAPAATAPTAVATFKGGTVTDADVEREGGAALTRLRQQMHDAKVTIVNQIIFDRLLEAEATAQQMTAEQYLEKVVMAGIAEPAEAEVQKVLTQYRSRLPADDAQAHEMVVTHLRQQGQQGAQEALRKRLFATADVKVLLDPPRVEPVVAAHNPSQGAATAPITIVEYTDFQCPYCSRVQTVVNQVKARYGDSVRHVFKHLPLPMHQQARLAAEASLCAADQGKFWPYHDWMFANPANLGREILVEQAKAQGLDEAKFTACVDGQVHTDHVAADMAEAQTFGITGTPGFVINGRVLSGAQPLEAFSQIIDDELARRGLPIPPPPAAPEPAAPAPAPAAATS